MKTVVFTPTLFALVAVFVFLGWSVMHTGVAP